MKYIVAFTANRKNAKRHLQQLFGHTQYFDSVAEAEARAYRPKGCKVEIYTAKWEFVKEVQP